MTYEIGDTVCAPYWLNVFQGERGTTFAEPCRTVDDAIDEIFHEFVPPNATYCHTIMCLGDGSPVMAVDLMPEVMAKHREQDGEREHERQEGRPGYERGQ